MPIQPSRRLAAEIFLAALCCEAAGPADGPRVRDVGLARGL